ncbi:cation transporter [Flavobacterium akiainvivens]|uniref:Cation transporter n=1 Tax=Flavobacterium akiainvivens TaxID=1202724 RepID=A0A0M9VJC3_9FLAO|nr:CusA/CzcA family heavy metal efflux RND transporter [Flavobacterium akiainvivens]KOS07309.1 cation transporter [Flavobacterium akiainvivens]SFQ46508.1 cobalt-zinc-cadmium resistance protein CzcA [Flavobacterium akiainvivens]
MVKMIKNIIGFSLRNKLFTFFWVAIVVIAGVISYKNIPVEAFPDVTNTQIVIVTQWPGRSAEEVERFVTSPIEISMNSLQKKTNVRSITMFGLSVIKIIFDDDVEDFFARQQVNNLLGNVELPEGIDPEVQPPYGPTGEIFRYTLESPDKDTRELLTLQNWVIDRQLRAVPGVADVAVFGGREKTYEVEADPTLLQKYELTSPEVFEAISKANLNVGGDVIEKNGQAYVVRGVGLLDNIADIENTIVAQYNGNPILIKDIGKVVESNVPRVGQVGLNDKDDVVEGIVIMRKGENPSIVLKAVKEKIAYVQENVIPKDVKMVTFYDRDNLMEFCTKTVTHNLVEGIILVTVIVLLFMADWRTTVIVAIIIPLALLFAFLCLRLKGMSANLLSLGAVDFGIIIDGAVVMVEGLFVTLDHLRRKEGDERFNKLAKMGLIRKTGSKLGVAIFFSKLIIISALLPIFSFEKVEGKMFSPLAWTLGFALLGALIFTLTLVPVLCSILLNKNVREKHNPFVEFFNNIVAKGLAVSFKHKKISMLISFAILGLTMFSARFMGTEFLPPLNEGALWVTAELPISNSLTESVKMAGIIRKELKSFEEVDDVMSQTGRSNDGTDPNGFGFLQFQVDLKPKEEWKHKITMDELVEQMNQKLSVYQGITWNYSQPVIDNVAEAVAGFKASNAVKIYGDDLQVLDKLANQVMAKIENIDGVKDVGVLRNLGQPAMSVKFDEQKMALYGVQKSDAQSIIEMAVGGKTATEKYEGEKKFDIRLRYRKEYRQNEEDIMNLMVPTLRGGKVPLKEIATLTTETGPSFVYRDNAKRFIGVKFSVRDRDLGGTIAEAQAKVKEIKLPDGYTVGWTGEYENQIRASAKLAQVVPVSLVLIFVLLFIMFGNIKDSLLVLVNVPFAIIGGILALQLTGINFGISAGVGFIALLGICIQNGVILVSEFHSNLKNKMSLASSVIEGVKSRTRPVVMTALMAAIGLMPAALSTGIGSESQKPLAVSIIGGLITATVFTLLVFPNFFYWAMKNKHEKLEN